MKEKLKELEARRKRTRAALIINIVAVIIIAGLSYFLITAISEYSWLTILISFSSSAGSLIFTVGAWNQVNQEIDLLNKDE